MNKQAVALIALVLAICVPGCHADHKAGDAPRTERASAAAGWKDISTSGVTLRLPTDWKAMEIGRDLLEKGADKVMGNDPKMAGLRAQAIQMAKQGLVKLMAFETSTIGSGFATNCNVSMQDMGQALPLEQVAAATVAQITPAVAPGTQPRLDYVTAKSGKLALIRSEMKPQSPTIPELVSLLYITVNGQKSAAVAFTAPKSSEQHVRAIAEQAMEGFRFE
jgi:hypothetical protein